MKNVEKRWIFGQVTIEFSANGDLPLEIIYADKTARLTRIRI